MLREVSGKFAKNSGKILDLTCFSTCFSSDFVNKILENFGQNLVKF